MRLYVLLKNDILIIFHFFFYFPFSVFVLYLCAVLESSVAAVITLLMAEPQGFWI